LFTLPATQLSLNAPTLTISVVMARREARTIHWISSRGDERLCQQLNIADAGVERVGAGSLLEVLILK
jgi:hypothetical protein